MGRGDRQERDYWSRAGAGRALVGARRTRWSYTPPATSSHTPLVKWVGVVDRSWCNAHSCWLHAVNFVISSFQLKGIHIFLIGWVTVQYWMGNCPISLDTGCIYAVFARVQGTSQICKMSPVSSDIWQLPMQWDVYSTHNCSTLITPCMPPRWCHAIHYRWILDSSHIQVVLGIWIAMDGPLYPYIRIFFSFNSICLSRMFL